MNSESPVALTKTTYRGVTAYELKWKEGEVEKEGSFPTEAEAVMAMSDIEERLRIAAMAGQGLTVNPFGLHTPFISSKDVHFASLKLQPRGLKFRESIEDYVAAVTTLKGLDVSVGAAAAVFAESSLALKPYDISTEQAVFEWLELKKQVGDRPIYEVLRTYLQAKAAAAAEVPAPVATPPEAAGDMAAAPAT